MQGPGKGKHELDSSSYRQRFTQNRAGGPPKIQGCGGKCAPGSEVQFRDVNHECRQEKGVYIYISSPFLLDANSNDILCCLSACPPQAFLQLMFILCAGSMYPSICPWQIPEGPSERLQALRGVSPE